MAKTIDMNVIRPYEYNMTKEMAEYLLKNRNDLEKKKRPQDYLCEVVNNEFGIMGTCVAVRYY